MTPGWRYFMCEECGSHWREKCRDHETPSGSSCIECSEFVAPYRAEPHPEWPVDRSGNLIRSDNGEYEKFQYEVLE